MGKALNEKSKIRNDIIFIAVLLAFFALVGFIYTFTRGDGDTVTVTVDGEFFAEYPLCEDKRVEIVTGEKVNLLIIEGGKARVESATCPDGICVSHKPISRDGESIICLPNRVVITVRSSTGESPDIVA